MPLFIGKHEFILDDKGRVNVPVKFREQLPEDEPQLAIVKGLDGCVFMFPVSEFATFAERFFQGTQFSSDEKARLFRRLMLDGGSSEKPDKQGRIPLNDAQQAFAGLSKKGKVVIFGNMERMEIWNPERLQAHLAQGEDTNLDEMAKQFFGGTSDQI